MTSPSPGRRPSRWLRHVYPASFPVENYDDTQDLLRLRLEEITTTISNAIVEQHGVDAAEARSAASNILTDQALVIQRENAPDGYRAMLIALVGDDPELLGFRRELRVAAHRQAIRAAAVAGAVGAVVGGSLVAAVLAVIF